jgi:hypothetical protein
MELSQTKVINRLLKEFDFRQVRKVMKYLEWKWAYSNAKGHIPIIKELKAMARRLLEDVANDLKANSYTACGGFEVRKQDYYWFSLSFVLTGWEEPGEEEFNSIEEEETNRIEEEANKKFSNLYKSLEV